MIILITGATGFLGKSLIEEFDTSLSEHEIWIVVRSETYAKAQVLFKDKNVKILEGDLSHPEIFKQKDQEIFHETQFDYVIHLAALYKLNADYKDCYLHNTFATSNLVKSVNAHSSKPRLIYASTIAVGGSIESVIHEAPLENKPAFSDNYSLTKYQAEEELISLDKSPLVIRFGIIIGNSKTGFTDKFDGPYYIFKMIAKLKAVGKISILPIPFPGRAETVIPIIPVNHAARVIIEVLEKESSFAINYFHAFSPDSPKLKDFMGDLLSFYNLKFKIKYVGENTLVKKSMALFNIPKETTHFLNTKQSFEQENSQELDTIKSSKYSHYKKSIFDFANSKFRGLK